MRAKSDSTTKQATLRISLEDIAGRDYDGFANEAAGDNTQKCQAVPPNDRQPKNSSLGDCTQNNQTH